MALVIVWASDGVAVAAAPKPAKKDSHVACKQPSDDDAKPADKKSGRKKSAEKMTKIAVTMTTMKVFVLISPAPAPS